MTADSWKNSKQTTTDFISAVCASDTVLMVGRASGVVQRYSLPHLTVEGQHLLRCRPYMLALNCNTTRMSIIDINGVLSFYDLNDKAGAAKGATQGEHLAFERKVRAGVAWGGGRRGPAVRCTASSSAEARGAGPRWLLLLLDGARAPCLPRRTRGTCAGRTTTPSSLP